MEGNEKNFAKRKRMWDVDIRSGLNVIERDVKHPGGEKKRQMIRLVLRLFESVKPAVNRSFFVTSRCIPTNNMNS